MFEAGEDYQSIINLPFKMIEMEEWSFRYINETSAVCPERGSFPNNFN
jgi:hypothetical protein